MQDRTNLLFANVVRKGLILSKRKSVEDAQCMMMRAGLPLEVITRVLLQDRTINQFIRKTDTT